MPSLVSCHVTWCIHHSVNHCTSVLCEMQCYYAHKIHGDSCASNLSVLICKTESAQSHSHSSGTGTYENLFCARGTLPACSFRSLFDLFDFETLCLSKACYSKDLEGHLMSFWLQSARALCLSHCFCTWHGRNDMEWYSLRYRQFFLRESWELPPHVSKESPLSKHCRIASDCSLRFQLKTKHWSWRLWEMKLTCIRLLKLLTFLNHPNSIKLWWHCSSETQCTYFAWLDLVNSKSPHGRLKTLGLCTASPLCWAMIWGALSDLGWNAEVVLHTYLARKLAGSRPDN